MQPEHEADDLPALLREEYGAPPLDDKFSANLIARLQGEAATQPTLTPAKPRRTLLAICLGVAVLAASIFAIIWIANSGTPATNPEVARQDTPDTNRLALEAESESEESIQNDRLELLSDKPRRLSLSSESAREGESLRLSESLSSKSEGESKHQSESAPMSLESRAAKESKPETLSKTTKRSVLDVFPEGSRGILAAAALADTVYVVDGGHLYEVNPGDGSRRLVGMDDWRNTSAIGAAGGLLYIVGGHQLYEVDPTTGARRLLGKPEWTNTTAIVTAGDKLFIASGGHLHRVNPVDGSHEVLRSKSDRPIKPREPQP